MSPELDRPSGRFDPRAAPAMAEMFDDVSGRYDFLNHVLSLGMDGAWRAALGRAVPESARVVLDLCSGSGASLRGLRRPGRCVVGADVSLGMLELAAARQRPTGWAPRLVCADAFALPFRAGALDAVTIAFGMRNLRPRSEALAELARVLRTGGTLGVLEATAPAPGPLAPFHRFYLRRVVPLAGRLSADPSAYRYLARSILEFGPVATFERELAQTGFQIEERRRFLLGATRLWIARRRAPAGQIAADSPAALQNARATAESAAPGSRPPTPDLEWRIWTGVQLALSLAISGFLAYALWFLSKYGAGLPLSVGQRSLARVLLVAGLLGFGIRSFALLGRWLAGRSPR